MDIFDLAYPIGSVYMTFKKESPKIGTWILITQENYPVSTTEDFAMTTGGSYYHHHTTPNQSVSVSQLPAHSHDFYGPDNMTGYPQSWSSTTSSSNLHKNWWKGVNSTDSSSVGYTGSGNSHSHGDTDDSYYEPEFITLFAFYRIK